MSGKRAATVISIDSDDSLSDTSPPRRRRRRAPRPAADSPPLRAHSVFAPPPPKRRAAAVSEGVWATHCAPQRAAELAVHARKVADVRRWLAAHAGRGGALVLRGPPGCGS